jgi:DNA repair protein RecN (Recombination protein N)
VLVELIVENYAVVERVRLRLGPGLNVLTGETGSGKSIVVDALGLLFGTRASADMLRSGADRARVSGIFEAPRSAAATLDAAGIELDDGELIVEREILAGGKSRAFVGNRPATAALLRDLAPHLGDIHGQHDQQQLFSSDAQLALLDDFARTEGFIEELASVYRDWRACARELEELERTEQEKLRLLDVWTFQRNEIEAANLKPGEDAELAAERRVLQNVTKLADGANAAYTALYDAPESAWSQVRLALRRLEELSRVDENLAPVLDALRPAAVGVEDASATLRDYVGKLEADPDRLEHVETRLAAIERLKRKYGSSVEEILAFFDDLAAKLAAVENTTERRAAIEKDRARLASRYETLAAELSARRAEAARKLERQVEAELKTLAMERTVFRIELTPSDWSERGSDALRFLVSPNVGEEPRPLDKVASGGELSRIALALKTCVTGAAKRMAGTPRTLVFDEVDAGIGGAAAESVGRRLKRLAGSNQVLCVTHLAQIAGFADHHYAVEKREAHGRTVAEIDELAGDARTREIGRMLSGRVTPEALKHAEQLLRTGAEQKR